MENNNSKLELYENIKSLIEKYIDEGYKLHEIEMILNHSISQYVSSLLLKKKRKKEEKKFRIIIVSDYVLTENEIWPDNDGPENPTTQDVEDVIIEAELSLADVIKEWNLDPELIVEEV